MGDTIESHINKSMYDNFALGDECHRFGIMDGCKPWCPVFERGDCPIQADNEKLFNEERPKP